MTKDDRYLLDKVEFYITNVCNLNCDQCNRFNDYKFSGWQRWSDYADIYRRWAEVVDIKQIVILGGEPLLNPSINEWILGLANLWKNRPIQILTNGTRLNHTPGLYETLLSCHADANMVKHWIGVSVHNMADLGFLVQEAKTFLRGEIKILTDKSNIHGAELALIDINEVKICFWVQDNFYNAAVTKNQNGELTLFNNDPEESHKHCGFVQWKNYHFIRGTLNKCGPAPLFPEFDQQHPLAVSSADRDLINAYRPFTVDQVEQHGTDILKNIDLVLPQCKFCPVPADMKYRQIHATLKNKTIPISQIRANELHGLQ
jgi:organic radical activating enzyme